LSVDDDDDDDEEEEEEEKDDDDEEEEEEEDEEEDEAEEEEEVADDAGGDNNGGTTKFTISLATGIGVSSSSEEHRSMKVAIFKKDRSSKALTKIKRLCWLLATGSWLDCSSKHLARVL